MTHHHRHCLMLELCGHRAKARVHLLQSDTIRRHHLLQIEVELRPTSTEIGGKWSIPTSLEIFAFDVCRQRHLSCTAMKPSNGGRKMLDLRSRQTMRARHDALPVIKGHTHEAPHVYRERTRAGGKRRSHAPTHGSMCDHPSAYRQGKFVGAEHACSNRTLTVVTFDERLLSTDLE